MNVYTGYMKPIIPGYMNVFAHIRSLTDVSIFFEVYYSFYTHQYSCYGIVFLFYCFFSSNAFLFCFCVFVIIINTIPKLVLLFLDFYIWFIKRVIEVKPCILILFVWTLTIVVLHINSTNLYFPLTSLNLHWSHTAELLIFSFNWF